jgi:hypothetical protein
MPGGRPRTFDLTLSDETRTQLEGIAGSRFLPAGLVRRALIHRITDYVTRYNRNSRPFTWIATADSILAKLTRLAKVISGTHH